MRRGLRQDRLFVPLIRALVHPADRADLRPRGLAVDEDLRVRLRRRVVRAVRVGAPEDRPGGHGSVDRAAEESRLFLAVAQIADRRPRDALEVDVGVQRSA